MAGPAGEPFGTAQEARPRGGPRRRGAVLEQAILASALAELSEVGYAAFSVERVAERAGTGKAALYRRWSSRADLVWALISRMPAPGPPPAGTGDLRQDLLELLTDMAYRYTGAYGEAVRGLVAEMFSDRQRSDAVREHIKDAENQAVREILDRAVVQGEIHPEAITPRVVEVGPVLVLHHCLTSGAPVLPEILVSIVDEVVLPLLRRGSGLGPGPGLGPECAR